MKKLVSILMVAMLVLSLAACGGSKSSAAGSYKFKSMTAEGQTVTAEQLEALGQDLEGFKLELKSNGEFAITVEAKTETGTWKEDGKKISLTMDGETVEAALDGNTVTFGMDGVELAFEKK